MKNFLQIQKDGILIPPKTLEMGVDFDTVRCSSKDNQYLTFIDGGLDCIVNLSDCFQSRPLLEIDGYCEFDLVFYRSDKEPMLILFDKDASLKIFGYSKKNQFYPIYSLTFQSRQHDTFVSRRSIFKPENQTKYPELYQGALNLIKKYEQN
jgi:hypothetical protein